MTARDRRGHQRRPWRAIATAITAPETQMDLAYQTLPAGCDPWRICWLEHERVGANDGTIIFAGQHL